MESTPLRSATSADGAMTLELFGDDDYLGFAGQAWHTHGELLVPDYGDAPKTAANTFFDSVVSDREIVCISDTPDGKRAIWITDDPRKELKYVEPGETLVMRLWSGQTYDPSIHE